MIEHNFTPDNGAIPPPEPIAPALKQNPYAELSPSSLGYAYQPSGVEAGMVQPLEPHTVAVGEHDTRDRLTRRQRLVRRGIPALLALTGASFGAGIGTFDAFHTGPRPASARGPVAGGESSHNQETLTTGNHSLDKAFRRAAALNNESSVTKLSANDLISAHNYMFGQKDLSKLSLEQYKAETASITEALKADRAKLSFATLPENFQHLADNESNEAVPLSSYEKTLHGFFQQFGVDAEFEWSPASAGVLASNVQPVPYKELRTSDEARTYIVDTINGFAQLPIELVQQIGLKRVMLGKILNSKGRETGGILGEVVEGDPTVMLDVWGLGASKLASTFSYNRDTIAETPTHEFEHAEDAFVGAGPGKSYNNDPAFVSLMPGFHYSKKVASKLTDSHPMQRKFVSLATSTEPSSKVLRHPGRYEVAVTDPYGATDPAEAKAVLLGQDVFDTQNTGQLFDTPSNESDLLSQLTLLVERMNVRNPDIGKFYMDSIKAARLTDAISAKISVIDEAGGAKKDGLLVPNPTKLGAYSKLLDELIRANPDNTVVAQ